MPLGQLLGAGLGILQAGVGLINKGKAKSEAERLAKSRPKYEISPYVGDEVSLAESELAGGLSPEATRAYEEGADRDLSSSLSTILRSGGGANNIGELYDQSQVGRLNLTKLREGIRLNKIGNLTNAWRNMTEQQDKEFEFNKWMPWADEAQANAAARQGAENQIWGGIGTAGSGLMSYFNQKEYQKMFNDYFGKPKQNNVSESATFEYGTPTFNTAQNNPITFTPTGQPNYNWQTFGDIAGNNGFAPTPVNNWMNNGAQVIDLTSTTMPRLPNNIFWKR